MRGEGEGRFWRGITNTKNLKMPYGDLLLLKLPKYICICNVNTYTYAKKV